jgi:hypothetical protein
MAAIERRHLDLASIGAADSQSSAPAAAQSMYWSSSKSAMVRLLGSTRTWARTVNGTLIQASDGSTFDGITPSQIALECSHAFTQSVLIAPECLHAATQGGDPLDAPFGPPGSVSAAWQSRGCG